MPVASRCILHLGVETMMHFTKEDATSLARHDRGYRVKRHRGAARIDGRDYGVWDDVSEHWVEFEHVTSLAA